MTHRYQLGDGAGAGFTPLASLYRKGPAAAPADVAADAPFAVISTAAVDVVPRGAVLTHANVIAANLTTIGCLGFTARDRYLVALPLFHVSALGDGHGPHARGRRQRDRVALRRRRRRWRSSTGTR